MPALRHMPLPPRNMTTERARPGAVPEATTRELLAWLVRRRRRFVVTGSSMEPTLHAGDVVLIDHRAYQTSRPPSGDVVVLLHPRQSELRIVKRSEGVEPDGRVRVLSDNLTVDAADSRLFGPVDPSLLVGRVTGRIGR